jgi:hypothetical protein
MTRQAACLVPVCLLVSPGLVARGGTRPAVPSVRSHVLTSAAALQARLRTEGYTVKDDVTFGGPLPALRMAFSVHDVDFATRHAFSVAVHGFGSHSAAPRFADAVHATLASFAGGPSHRLINDRRVQVAAAYDYLGFAARDTVTCSYLGLCAPEPSYGIPTFRMTAAGAFRCTPVPIVPPVDLRRLVATAEGA